MITKAYRDRVLSDLETLNLSLELFEEVVRDTTSEDKTRVGEIVRLYITSPSLGGALAVNHGEGWMPIFPERGNYPIKHQWYSPALRVYKAKENWWDAVIDALDPAHIPALDRVGNKVAIERAAKLRHPLKAAAAVAKIKSIFCRDATSCVSIPMSFPHILSGNPE